ncbi:MAG: DeoR/GlpR transcriptional regulator [Butyrivibrio sp.]|jgi:DeoR family fructose operon transcriptional repressor|uniref:DeoR/GlpR family DNA-binding transcription regulator n=1 Tax=Butyrivibrio sp. TaxID=28121 RepID=UPI001ED4773B|nr:DeoR/GlpR family DNA-binding transcription regulator [Butyrivibrio sp.]MBE5840507.1 DeoR/GlpR transcriptional regulator [Butyrivibrio sp.]MCR4756939.1 DeoR/GlpR family DNA-binding transcription regulator [Butyrivibrio sp.]
MLTKERRDLIVSYINENNAVTVAQLMEQFDASAATIRRDLSVLHDEKRILKVFGGATSLSSTDVNTIEPTVSAKASLNIEEKEAISRYAASLINDDDFVYIDSGTTTLEMIKYIDNTKAKYITNGIVHAKKLLEKNLSTMIIGGRCKFATEAIIGPDCIEGISKYHFTKAFMGTNGISLTAGFTTPDVDEALVKAEAVKHAYISYILADHSKFGLVSSVTFADITKCCIITDKEPKASYGSKTIIKVV